MKEILTRRRFSVLTGTILAGAIMGRPRVVRAAGEGSNDLNDRPTEIEVRLGARLGVAVIDTGTGRRWGHRANERFPLCSTFKVLAAAAVLARVDAGEEDLTRRVRFEAGELVAYSPVTSERVGGEGMTLAELCGAAVTRSDNTASNLLLRSLGGPAGLTAFTRSLGDAVARLDRWETDLNEATPGDPRDTTTPAAMAANLRALVVENRLSARGREQLTAWLVANQTGDARLRAGLPPDWRIGDKTGSGEHGTTNDVAVVWPPGERPPIVVCVYLTETTASSDARNAAIAEVARAIGDMLNA